MQKRMYTWCMFHLLLNYKENEVNNRWKEMSLIWYRWPVHQNASIMHCHNIRLWPKVTWLIPNVSSFAWLFKLRNVFIWNVVAGDKFTEQDIEGGAFGFATGCSCLMKFWCLFVTTKTMNIAVMSQSTTLFVVLISRSNQANKYCTLDATETNKSKFHDSEVASIFFI